MSDFDALQRAIEVSVSARQAETRACDACLTALYHALRHASGPGLPLNNVSMELLPDPQQRLRPAPLGGWYVAWFRVGLCEVLVRVRRDPQGFVGEYGAAGHFKLLLVNEAELLGLAREMMRSLAAGYGADARTGSLKN